MISDCDLPFALVEQKLFQELMGLLNEDAITLANHTNQVSIARHVGRMFQESKKTIKNNYLKNQISISFTQDAWTAPNVTAFMAVTAHFIDKNFQMRDLTLAVPHVEGVCFFFVLNGILTTFLLLTGIHNGKKFAELFFETLERYSVTELLHTITADNASVNGKMARELDLQISHFKSSTHILGCVAHVINLVAKIGILALGSFEDDGDGNEVSMATNNQEPSTQPCQMNIGMLISAPDEEGINSQTILKRIHGLCTWVRFSPQQRERFAVDVNSCQPNLFDKDIKGLEIDVPTRWNATYSMLKRATLLEKSCNHFCRQNTETTKFILSSANVMKLWRH
jgi:hypothetical protein